MKLILWSNRTGSPPLHSLLNLSRLFAFRLDKHISLSNRTALSACPFPRKRENNNGEKFLGEFNSSSPLAVSRTTYFLPEFLFFPSPRFSRFHRGFNPIPPENRAKYKFFENCFLFSFHPLHLSSRVENNNSGFVVFELIEYLSWNYRRCFVIKRRIVAFKVTHLNLTHFYI